MQGSFEKIIEKLEEEKMSYFLTIANTGDEKLDYTYEKVGNALDKAIEIVKQEAEQYNNGWIPCSSVNKPKDNKWVFGYTDYHEIVPTFFENGVWHDNYGSPIPELKIIAYCTLPAPYQPKGE